MRRLRVAGGTREMLLLVVVALVNGCGGKMLASTGDDAVSGRSGSGGNGAGGDSVGGTGAASTGGTKATSHPNVTGFDKVDLLFMIDSSLSMGDKQEVLAFSVPYLLRQLTNPDCLGADGQALAMPAPDEPCPDGRQRARRPVNDIHLGVITSSLGAFGGDLCPIEGAQNVAQNDHAWLLGALPRTKATLGAPFLAWTTSDAKEYISQSDAKAVEFTNHVRAATELGCGMEMGLEAWYRFLIDPKPPKDVRTTTASAPNERGPVDETILQLRQAFLRPDSLVAVVMMTDENDCSLRDDDYGWVLATAGGGFRMWRGSSVCAQNPNDPCCYACMLSDKATADCRARDTTCTQSDPGAKLSATNDDVNVRCRRMKQRFGHDFLFPPSRYVNALTHSKLCPDQTYGNLDCDCVEAKRKGLPCTPGTAVDNPLFLNLNPSVTPSGPLRPDAQAVYLVGILGVPWQDLAVDPSARATLEYKKATALDWDLFSPKPDEDYAMATIGDPLMIESFKPRTGTHPITGESLAPPEAARLANSINGHEWNTADKDVQFACIFNLDAQFELSSASAIRTCDLILECGADNGSNEFQICARRFDSCSCTMSAPSASTKSPFDPTVSLSPLCQAPNGSYGNVQYFAKAYPSLRNLQVLRGFYEATGSDNAIVGSICPKEVAYFNRFTAGSGYNPAFRSLMDVLSERLLAP